MKTHKDMFDNKNMVSEIKLLLIDMIKLIRPERYKIDTRELEDKGE